MRALVILVGLVGVTTPALACPPRDKCLVQLRSTVGDVAESLRTSAEPAPLALRLDSDVQARPRLEPGEVEMPWIWRALREQVYSRMPTYEERDRTETKLKLVLAPVVVTSTTDTVPGLGIAGDF